MKIAILFPHPLSAAITNVVVDPPSNTQAIIRYTAPDSAACTHEVSESASYTPLIHDLNTSLFASSNTDARTGSLSNGRYRSFVVGLRDAPQAIDGRRFSRALQAHTVHYHRNT